MDMLNIKCVILKQVCLYLMHHPYFARVTFKYAKTKGKLSIQILHHIHAICAIYLGTNIKKRFLHDDDSC